MMILPIQDQLFIQEVIEYIIQKRRAETSVDEIMNRFHLTRAEYNMIENLAIPAYKQSNEAEAYKTRYNLLKSRVMNTKAKWAAEVIKAENEGGEPK